MKSITQSATLGIAVAAKGYVEIARFIAAIIDDGLANNAKVSIHIAHDETLVTNTLPLASNVHLHPCVKGTSILQLWGVAIDNIKADYVAVLDVNCPPKIGWRETVLSEIDKKTPLFCGDVEPGWPLDDIKVTGYLTEYAQFNTPTPAKLNEVPGNNIVFNRGLLDGSIKLGVKGFYKTYMVWHAEKEKGIRVHKCQGMAVLYYKPFARRHYMHRRYEHGRCFAATRFDNQGQPLRITCLLFTFALPCLRVWRIFKGVKRNPELKKSFFRFFVLILQSEVAWSFGEMMGYAIGGRRYCEGLD